MLFSPVQNANALIPIVFRELGNLISVIAEVA